MLAHLKKATWLSIDNKTWLEGKDELINQWINLLMKNAFVEQPQLHRVYKQTCYSLHDFINNLKTDNFKSAAGKPLAVN